MSDDEEQRGEASPEQEQEADEPEAPSEDPATGADGQPPEEPEAPPPPVGAIKAEERCRIRRVGHCEMEIQQRGGDQVTSGN